MNKIRSILALFWINRCSSTSRFDRYSGGTETSKCRLYKNHDGNHISPSYENFGKIKWDEWENLGNEIDEVTRILDKEEKHYPRQWECFIGDDEKIYKLQPYVHRGI